MIKEAKKTNPVEGVITSSFGERLNPITNKTEFHNGIDISAEIGTEAVSPFDGEVAEIWSNDASGNVLEIECENGYRLIFAHLSEYRKNVGDKVKEGEAVALTGNTGFSTGPHLHFGMKKNGEYIDPYDFVLLTYTEEVAAEYEARGEKAP